MKKFYLKTKNNVPDEVVRMDDVLPANPNIEPLTDYEAFKMYDSGVVRFSPLAEYAITNLMTVPAYAGATRKAEKHGISVWGLRLVEINRPYAALEAEINEEELLGL